MQLDFNTPALLFPAISLLLLAYTNRFVALANLVRRLHDQYKSGQTNQVLSEQIRSLKKRINLIRYMQALGVFSFLCSVISMVSIYKSWDSVAETVFGIGLLSLLVSLFISLVEIFKSTGAIELELGDMEEKWKKET